MGDAETTVRERTALRALRRNILMFIPGEKYCTKERTKASEIRDRADEEYRFNAHYSKYPSRCHL
jgi:hypothetical protein